MLRSLGRQMGGGRRDIVVPLLRRCVGSRPLLSVYLLRNAADPVFGCISRGAFYNLILPFCVGWLRGMPRSSRLRVGLVLWVCTKGLLSNLGIFVASHELLLSQRPRSVGEPFCEAR